jgi:DNA invertase Pin-like site-specific DNA recombinase
MLYGYARVSTDGQSVEAQVRQLRAAAAGKVFCEVPSGAKTDRAQLRRVLAELGSGDGSPSPGATVSRNPPAIF